MKKRTVTFVLLMVILVIGLSSAIVNKALAANLSVTPSSASVGSEVTVKGSGFNGTQVMVYFDKIMVGNKVRQSGPGEFMLTFKVPETTRGQHAILVTDNGQPQGPDAEAVITVTPKFKIDSNYIRKRDEVAISGTGFAANEPDIVVIVDGKPVMDFIKADYKGSWGSRFTANLENGEHVVDVRGSVTLAQEVEDAPVMVVPLIKLASTKGKVGGILTLYGYGFRSAEDGCSVTFDGEMISYNTVADTIGNWKVDLKIPAAAAGSHIVGAYATFTYDESVPKVRFEVIPVLTANTDSAKAGEKVTIFGAGFAGNQNIRLSLGGRELGRAVSDALGNFEANVPMPQLGAGMIEIGASDDQRNSASAVINMTSVEVPKPITVEARRPVSGSQITIFPSAFAAIGGFLDNFGYALSSLFNFGLKVDFDWDNASANGKFTYNLQIATEKDFTRPVVLKTNLPESSYTLEQNEALPEGSYFWRVRAIDTYGSQGQWSEPQSFSITPMGTVDRILVTAVTVIIVAVLLAFVFRIVINLLN